jgi:hypothetical protein
LTWLKLLLALSELLVTLMRTAQERRLIEEGELRGSLETARLTNERLRKAIEARASARDSNDPAGGVRDDDPYLRD